MYVSACLSIYVELWIHSDVSVIAVFVTILERYTVKPACLLISFAEYCHIYWYYRPWLSFILDEPIPKGQEASEPNIERFFPSKTLKNHPFTQLRFTLTVLGSSSGSQRSRSPGSSGWHRLAFWFGASLQQKKTLRANAASWLSRMLWFSSRSVLRFKIAGSRASLWHRHSAVACWGCMQGYHLACFLGNGAVQRGILAS